MHDRLRFNENNRLIWMIVNWIWYTAVRAFYQITIQKRLSGSQERSRDKQYSKSLNTKHGAHQIQKSPARPMSKGDTQKVFDF
jgi:hypothetical protein